MGKDGSAASVRREAAGVRRPRETLVVGERGGCASVAEASHKWACREASLKVLQEASRSCRRPSDQSERGISEEWSERQLLIEAKWDGCEIERRQGWRGGFQWLQWVETINYQLKFKSKGMRRHNWSVPLRMKWCPRGPTHLYLVRKQTKSHCKEIIHVLVKSDSREKLYLKHQRNIRIYNPES